MNIRNLLLAGTAATALTVPLTPAHAQSGNSLDSETLEGMQLTLPEQCLGLEREPLEACLAELGLVLPDVELEEVIPEEAEPAPEGDAEADEPGRQEEAPAEVESTQEVEPEADVEAEPDANPTEQFLLPEQCQDVAPEDVQACLESLQGEQQDIMPAPEPVPEAQSEILPEEPVDPAEDEPPEDATVEEAPEPQERPQLHEIPAEEDVQPDQIDAPEAEAEMPAQSDMPRGLSTAAADYEAAVAEFRSAVESGGDVAAARENLSAAYAELQSVCAAIGIEDLNVCLATFGIRADIISPDEIEAAGVADADADADAEGDMEAEEPETTPRDDDMLGEILPEGVDSDAVAPLLDSAKDALTGIDEPAPEEPAEAEPQAEAEEPAPAPQSDVEAQSTLEAVDIEPITTEEGTRREAPVVTEEDDGDEAVVVGRIESERPQNLDVIEQLGLSLVFEFNNHLYIDTPDTDRLYYENDTDYYIEDLPNGRTREVILRADGSRIVTIRDRYGEIVRRSRIEPDGTEILLVYVDERYNRYDEQGRWIDPGSQLPPLRLTIPPQEYVLDASAANAERIETFLYQPPVEQIQRYYTLDEVKRSARIRDMVRRLEIGDLTFETNSAAIPPDQLQALSAVANAMLDLLARNPAETFLIEGHTDAVGSDLYNLELSDRRAESVAYALTRVYGIPAENLATQGYGERYLKVNTPFAERINRRVTIRRITPLITPVAGTPAG